MPPKRSDRDNPKARAAVLRLLKKRNQSVGEFLSDVVAKRTFVTVEIAAQLRYMVNNKESDK